MELLARLSVARSFIVNPVPKSDLSRRNKVKGGRPDGETANHANHAKTF